MEKPEQFQYQAKARFRGNKMGFITVEMLVALSLLVVSLTSLTILGFGSQSLTVDSYTNDEALQMAILQLENARKTAKTNFESITATSTTNGIYSSQLSVENFDCLKHVSSQVTWNRNNRPQTTKLETYISNPPEAFRFGGDCRIGFPNTWLNPGTYDSIDISPGGNNGTDLDLQRVNGVRYIFLSSVHSTSSSPDLWIFDFTQLNNPTLVNSIDTGSGVNALDAAKVGDNYYIFAAQEDENKQLQIIDVTNPASPVVVAEKKLEGIGNPDPEGQSITFYNNRVYIGTRATNGDEFQIYDVSTPSNPTLLGKISVNQDVRDIEIRNELISGGTRTIAYLGLSSTGSDPELRILDVTNTSNITTLTSLNLVGNEPVNAISLSGNKMFFGRDGHNTNPEIYAYDITNPTSPTLLGTAQTNLGTQNGITNILVLRDLLFVGTNDPNQEFQVWGVANPSTMVQYSSFNFSQETTGLDYIDDLIVISAKSNDSLRIIYDQDNPPQ